MSGKVWGRLEGKDAHFGWAGNYARQSDMIVSTYPNVGTRDITFGRPVISVPTGGYMGTNIGGVALADGTTTADNFMGFAISRVKANTTSTLIDQFKEGGGYAPFEEAAILQRGSISVLVDEGTPEKGGTMWIRTVTASGGDGTDIGNICASEPAEGGIEIPKIMGQFVSPADERKVAEYRLKVQPNV